MQTQFTRTIRQWALLLSGASLLLTCADPRPAVNAEIPLHSTATLDLGSVIQQVHSAFHREGPQFVAARDTYRVNATRDGAFTITGYHYPAGTRSSAPLVASPLRVYTAAVTGLDGGLAPPSEARVEGPGGLLFRRNQFPPRLGNRSGFGRKDPGGAHGTDGSGARQDGCHGEQHQLDLRSGPDEPGHRLRRDQLPHRLAGSARKHLGHLRQPNLASRGGARRKWLCARQRAEC